MDIHMNAHCELQFCFNFGDHITLKQTQFILIKNGEHFIALGCNRLLIVIYPLRSLINDLEMYQI
jgi:hypothetical protein